MTTGGGILILSTRNTTKPETDGVPLMDSQPQASSARRKRALSLTLHLLLAATLCFRNVAQASIEAFVNWNKSISVLKTIPTIIACPFRPIPGSTPTSIALQDTEFSILRGLGVKQVRWHLINASRQVAEHFPPTKVSTSWNFSQLDEDMIRFLESSKGQEPIVNFTMIPFWMFKTGKPVPRDSNSYDPNDLREEYLKATTSDLVDPTGKMLGDYFARIVSWYTEGGFTDENGMYHKSGYHYEIPWWGVLNELDDVTPTQYNILYDAIVSAVHKVSPRTRFVGLSQALPSLQPQAFETFLNPENHQPGVPLDMVAYHFYAGAVGLGGSSASETISDWQYTFFTQAAAMLSTVRYIESIRMRLAPNTRVDLDEIGAFLGDDVSSEHHPDKAKPIPSLYWNLNGAVFAYLYIELAKMGIDVVTASGIYDRPHGLPGYKPSITFIDPSDGKIRAPIQVLRLIANELGPGDRLVSTHDVADPLGQWYPEISSSDVAMQAFATSRGKKMLIVNKRLSDVDVNLAKAGAITEVKVVDEQSKEGAPRTIRPAGSVLHLGAFAVALVGVE